MKHSTKLLVIIATAVSTVAFAGAGWAYWTTTGTGSGSATVGTLAAPVITTPVTATGSTVSLAWSAVSPPGAGSVSYFVLRDNAAASAACGTSASPIAGTNCSDTTVPNGLHSYTVTAKFQSWTATSASASVTVNSDTVPPTVTSVSSPKADGSYTKGTLIPVTVTFSEPVTVTGTPQLTLSTGSPATTALSYTGGSGTNTLTFDYTVAAGNTSADLNYGATNALTPGGTIKDAAGNNATLTLPGLTAAGSLGANKAIVIDTAAPVAPSVPNLADASDSGSSTTDNITNDNTPRFTGNAEAGAMVTVFDGGVPVGSVVATGGSYTIDSSTLSDGVHAITAKTTDAAGNTSGSSSILSVTIDTVAPVLGNVITVAPGSHNDTFDGTTNQTTGTITVHVYTGATATGTPFKVYTATFGGSSPTFTWTKTTGNNNLNDSTQYTAQATHVDVAGNASNQPTVTFTATP